VTDQEDGTALSVANTIVVIATAPARLHAPSVAVPARLKLILSWTDNAL